MFQIIERLLVAVEHKKFRILIHFFLCYVWVHDITIFEDQITTLPKNDDTYIFFSCNIVEDAAVWNIWSTSHWNILPSLITWVIFCQIARICNAKYTGRNDTFSNCLNLCRYVIDKVCWGKKTVAQQSYAL